MSGKWDNAKKKAMEFAATGFVVGAVLGAGLALGLVGILIGLTAGISPAGAATASAFAEEALSSWLPLTLIGGTGAALGAAAGSLLGYIGGSAYGSLTDVENPGSFTVSAAAHKITEKAPALANAITANVIHKELTEQAAKQGSRPGFASPSLARPPVPPATASFQDRIVTTPPEMETSPQR